jgi:putative hydrolase of the HAD superfamily
LRREDIAHVDTWVFDLDNTLYAAGTNLFAQIDVRMKAFIMRELGLTSDAAFTLQKHYYRAHGTTLRGLMVHHNIDPDAFIDEVHDIDHTVLSHDPRLGEALTALPGRKVIYTNGSTRHAEKVLDRLGVAAHFDAIFDIRAGDFIPKPDPLPYQSMIKALGVAPRTAAMFEDSFKNLKPAHDLGMVTVWVRHPEHVPAPGDDLSHCHHTTDDVTSWLGEAVRVLKAEF